MLIGITGRAGAGKNVVGTILNEHHQFTVSAFATPIKLVVAFMLGVDVSQWEDREWKEATLPVWNRSPRELAQTLGTEWGRRQVHENIWIDLALHVIAADKRACITDIRFRNEADIIRAMGGHIVHVHRADSTATTPHDSHSSEQGIGNPNTQDFHVNNFGTIDDLAAQLEQVVNRIVVIDDARAAEDAERKEQATRHADAAL